MNVEASVYIAEWIIYLGRAYLWLGVIFAVPFVLFLVRRIDPAATNSTWGFRLILVPSAVWLWPLLALRLARGAGPTQEANEHRARARPSSGMDRGEPA